MEKSLFRLSFVDGSRFVLPEAWQEVFVATYGPDPAAYPRVAERLRYVAGKYIEHRAWPSKFDGIGMESEGQDIGQYDDPHFYFESWDDQDEERPTCGGGPISVPPTWAEVAEAVMYYSLRGGLLQRALDQMAREQGRAAPRVVTPEQFLQILEKGQEADENEP